MTEAPTEIKDLAPEALKLRFDAHLEEYKALREGMLAMGNTMTQVLLYSLVLMGAAVPLALSAVEKGWTITLLLVPPVFAGLLWFYYWLAVGVYEQGRYIERSLATEIRNIVGLLERRSGLDTPHLEEIWRWESQSRSNWQARHGFIRRLLGSSPAILIAFPALPALVLFVELKIESGLVWQWYEIGMLLLDLVLLVVALVVAPRRLRREVET